MNLGDLGIDTKTNRHDKLLTTVEGRFLGILWENHIGKDNKISANELAVRFDCAMNGFDVDLNQLSRLKKNVHSPGLDKKKRTIRHLHNHLLTMHDNVSILSKAGAGGGYWIAEDKDEAVEFYGTFRKRGMTGLVKASRGKKAVLIDMMSQLTFEFEHLAINVGVLDMPDIKGGDHAAIAIVDSFLGRMLNNPEKFSGGLRKLSEKYGSILLDKTQFAIMKSKASELKQLLDGLGV